MLRRLRAGQTGQAALETFIVFAAWFVLTMLVLNLMFIIASLMLNQSTVTRGSQQVASLGCLPTGVAEEIADRATFGTEDVEVRAAYVSPSADGTFDRDSVFDDQGRVRAGAARVPECKSSSDRRYAPSGSYVLVQASYKQRVVLLEYLGIPATFSVTRNALSVSNALEGGDAS